jgi:26S proteasome regulatory subunit N9
MEVLSRLVASNPAYFQAPVDLVSDHLSSKRWFELGLSLLNLLRLDAMVGQRRDVYDSLISKFNSVLDPFHLAEIIFIVSEEFPSPAASREFLESSLSKFDGAPNAQMWLNLHIVTHYIINGDFEGALSLVFRIAADFDHATDLAVRSLFYKVLSSLDKARGDYDAFYEHALLFLSISGQTGDIVLAYDLCTAALCGPTIFSFGEIATHAIIRALEFTENEWLMNLIFIMEAGSPTAIATFEETYLPILRSRPSFSPWLDLISMKVRLCMLQELIFQRPYESRVFGFNEVVAVCAVQKSEVEILVLKALSAGLIEGFIDEIEERFVVTRCKTKTVSGGRLQHLKDQIDRWCDLVNRRRRLLEEKAQAVVG